MTSVGLYTINTSVSNRPTGWSFGVVLVIKTGYLDVIQVAFSTNGLGGKIRYKPNGSSWSAWGNLTV